MAGHDIKAIYIGLQACAEQIMYLKERVSRLEHQAMKLQKVRRSKEASTND